MAKIRVAAFIDGFNLYHAIDNLRQNHLKWVDLRKLMACFTDPAAHELGPVYYFSAYATWLAGPYERHIQYVAALEHYGVTPVMGAFKEKDRSCRACDAAWKEHEEKESDVNLAVRILESAMDDEFDQAFVVTRDSDLSAPLRSIRHRFPDKTVKIIAPPGRRHSKELWGIAHKRASIQPAHLQSSLMPAEIVAEDGRVVATRPENYAPPD